MGRGLTYCWGLTYGEIFHGKGSLQEVNLSGEIIHWGIYQNSYIEFFLYVFLSLFRLDFTRGVVKGNSPGYFFTLLNCLEDISVGRKISPWD